MGAVLTIQGQMVEIGWFLTTFLQEMAKNTWWLNGCHGYHTKAISLILPFWRPNTPPSLTLLEQRVHELVGVGVH